MNNDERESAKRRVVAIGWVLPDLEKASLGMEKINYHAEAGIYFELIEQLKNEREVLRQKITKSL